MRYDSWRVARRDERVTGRLGAEAFGAAGLGLVSRRSAAPLRKAARPTGVL